MDFEWWCHGILVVYHGDPIKKMGLSIFALKDGISWGSAWGYHGSTANPMNIDPRELFLPGYTKSLDSFERFNDSCYESLGVSPNTTSRDKSSNKRGYIIAFFRNMCIPEFDGLSSCSWKKTWLSGSPFSDPDHSVSFYPTINWHPLDLYRSELFGDWWFQFFITFRPRDHAITNMILTCIFQTSRISEVPWYHMRQ